MNTICNLATEQNFVDLYVRMEKEIFELGDSHDDSGLIKEGQNIFKALTKEYNKKYRAYHNMNHINNCLNKLQLVKDKLQRPDYVEMAIWFHDVVYRRIERGLESEDLSVGFMHNLVRPHLVVQVEPLIVATKFHRIFMLSTEQKYMKDIDNSILGADTEEFNAYEKAIRKEFWFVPKKTYKEARLKFAKTMLDRDTIYFTKYFRDNYHSQTVTNLFNLIAYFEKE